MKKIIIGILLLMLLPLAFAFDSKCYLFSGGDVCLNDTNIYSVTNNWTFDFEGASFTEDDLNGLNISIFNNDVGYLTDANTSDFVSFYNLTTYLSNYYNKTEIDTLLDNLDINLTDYYNKTEIDALLADVEVDLSAYYNKTEIDNLNVSHFNNDVGYLTSYTETDPIWNSEKSNYYTSTQIDNFNFYSSTDFLITDYVLTSTLMSYGYYNSSDFNISDYYLASNPNGYISDYTVTSDDVTQHQADINITESQITDLQDYLLTETDPVWTADKSDYYTSIEVDNLPISTFSNDMGYLTSFTELDPYYFANPNGYYNSSDFNITDYYTQTQVDNNFLKLNQSTYQTITDGIPRLSSDRNITENYQLVDKQYVDTTVTSLGQRFYMLNNSSGIEDYKLACPLGCPIIGFSNEYTELTDGQYITGWINTNESNIPKLSSGVYSWKIFLEKSAGTKDLRVYWTLNERLSNGTEILIETSATSGFINGKNHFDITLNLDSDYILSEYSNVVGKIYAVVGTSGLNPSLTIYGGGEDDSHWEIPTNKEILDTLYYSTSNPNNYYNSSDFNITDYYTSTQVDNLPISTFSNDVGYITDYTVTSADVTQHQADINITESQITDLQDYLLTESDPFYFSNPNGYYNSSDFNITDYYTQTQVNNLPISTFSNDVGYITDYTVTSADVTQHQADINITESQITDLQDYLLTESDPFYFSNPNGYYNSSDFVISDYYTSAQVNALPVSTFTNDAGYLTSYTETDPVWTAEKSDYYTSTQINSFNYYNLTDFDINDYVLATTLSGYNYYNSSDFVISDYYTKTEVDNKGYITNDITTNIDMNNNNVTAVDCITFTSGGQICSS